MSGLVAFRADASRTLGYGHVMRCLALADVLRDKGASCLFISSQDGDALSDEVAARGHLARTLPAVVDEPADAAATLATLAEYADLRATVMDHYGLGPDWESAIRHKSPLLVIDDLPRSHNCDALLDQNVVDLGNPYADFVPADCHCFLGPRYALLRPEFARLRQAAPVRHELKRILIFFGGSDPTNETGKALRGLMAARGAWEVDVIIGSSNPHSTLLNALISQATDRFRLHIQTRRMAELMAAADLAIGAGGSASWERCCLRLPSIVSILADNQAAIAERLARTGAAINLGNAELLVPADYTAAVTALDAGKLAALSENSTTLTDGRGAERLAEEIGTFIRSMQ